jgi:hypothetical protein
VWVVGALLLVVLVRPAAAVNCFQPGLGQYWNNTSEPNQDPSIPRAMYGKVWRPGGGTTTPYLAVAMGGKILNIYDLTNPVLTTAPFVANDLWRGFLQTIKTYPFGFISVVDGSTIGYASFSVNGYVIFRFNPSTRSVDQLYKYEWNSINGLRSAHLFKIGSQLYLAGRLPTTADGTTYMSGYSTYSINLTTGVPTHVGQMDYGFAINDNVVCYLVQSGGKTYLYAQVPGGIDVWDISTPSAPVKKTSVPLAITAPDALVRDEVNPNLSFWWYSASNTVKIMDLTNPEAPVQKGAITATTGYFKAPAAFDGLLYIPITGSTTTMGASYAVSLSPTGGAALVVPIPDSNPPVLNRAPVTMEGPQGAAIYGKANNLYWVYRQSLGVGDWVTVDPSCVATTPNPSITVTDTTSTAASCSGTPTSPSTGIVGKGFPGDVLSVENGSTGLYQTATLDITYNGTPILSGWNALSNPVYSWDTDVTTPSGYSVSPPGEYLVTLDLTDSTGVHYIAYKSIFLCGDPKAALAFVPPSSASMLVGETVNLTAAASTGQPDKFGGYTFVVTPPGGGATSFYAGMTKIASHPLTTGGSYSFVVVTHYSFQASDDSACATYGAFLTSGYDSCSSPLTVNAGWGVSSFEVMQGGQVVVLSGGTGSILWDQPTTLRFTGRVASGYVPNFVWNISGVATQPTCSFTAAPYTNTTCGPIAAGTWQAGTAVTMNMNLQVCTGTPGVACATPLATLPAPTVNVTAVAVGATVTPSATNVNVGQAVTFTLTGAVPDASSFQSLVLNFPAGSLCSGVTAVTLCQSSACVVNSSKVTVTFQNPGTSSVPYTVTLSGTTSLGTPVAGLDSDVITVGAASSGSCTQTVVMTASPNPVTAGSAITFTINPGVTQGSLDVLNVTFGDGATGSVTGAYCGGFIPCNKVTHVYSTAGTYSATVSGTLNSAPAASTALLSITVNRAIIVTVTITPSPNPAQVSQAVAFRFSPSLTATGDNLTFVWGDGTSSLVAPGFGGSISAYPHTYASTGTFNVSASGTIGGVTATGGTSVVVQGTTPPPPGSGLTLTVRPNPANVGDTVSITFTPLLSAPGDSVTIYFGDGSSQVLSGQFACQFGQCGTSHVYTTANTYQVSASGTVGGKSGLGGNAQLVVQQNTCTETSVPVADFTWAPSGQLAGFAEQYQPYVGQQVTLTASNAGGADEWQWYDFQELTIPPTTVTTQTFGPVTWTQPGEKNVRVKATNCFGRSSNPAQWSAEVLKAIPVYSDVRHVAADFTVSPERPSTGVPVTLVAAQGFANGDPDNFEWTFDDGTAQQYGSSISHTFACGGNRTVTLKAWRGNFTDGAVTTAKQLAVGGPSCGPESVMAVDAAKVQGTNNTNWHADVRIYNPSALSSLVTVEFLPVGWDNSTRNGYFRTLVPRETWVLDDIIQQAQDKAVISQDVKKTALRVTYKDDDDVPPVVTVRTYNLLPDGSKYGQINPGVNVVPGTTPPVQWMTGLRNNGLTDGFRTNYSIVNLRGDAGGVGGITFTLFDETGTVKATKTLGLAPFGYIQDSVKNLFGKDFGNIENIGTFSLKVELPTDTDVQVYASVMDNHTGDPVMITAATPADSPIYLPAMAHISGEANTVWRTDLQVTNPDSGSAHTWEIRYTPKGTNLSVVARSFTLEPSRSAFADNLVSWVYEGSATPLPEDAQTSGIVRIAPTDGSNVYPVVAARSYNLTATGTFGQGIPPLWAAKGISTSSNNTRLVITGMSSEDIARTNLGFVNLSETQGVNFVVYFYDEGGRVLNPTGTDSQPKPYTYAIGPGTWDQDKLENRFKNGLKVALPSGLRAITAEITVTDGGPGFAYATVIDTKTGDPNFMTAQQVP